jgi:hypothetical protein
MYVLEAVPIVGSRETLDEGSSGRRTFLESVHNFQASSPSEAPGSGIRVVPLAAPVPGGIVEWAFMVCRLGLWIRLVILSWFSVCLKQV